jgi:hypothetical protein
MTGTPGQCHSVPICLPFEAFWTFISDTIVFINLLTPAVLFVLITIAQLSFGKCRESSILQMFQMTETGKTACFWRKCFCRIISRRTRSLLFWIIKRDCIEEISKSNRLDVNESRDTGS